MKTYFGSVDYEADVNSTFKFNDFEYDFCLEIDEEQVVIKDSLGRYVPMSYTAALDLLQALKQNKKIIKGLSYTQVIDDRNETCV